MGEGEGTYGKVEREKGRRRGRRWVGGGEREEGREREGRDRGGERGIGETERGEKKI